MQKFSVVFLCAALSSACGRHKESAPEVREELTPEQVAPQFKAECIIPGERDDQCLGYHLIPVFP